MKKILVVILVLLSFSIAYGENYSTDQILNKVYSNGKLNVSSTSTLSTIEVTTYNTTIMKRFTLSPNTDSGTNLTFSSECSKWLILNMADTAEIYIKFGSAATTSDFKIPAGSGISGDSKVTTIHAISSDTAEVQAIGYKN